MEKSPLIVKLISTDLTEINLSATEKFAFVTYWSCIWLQAHGSGGSWSSSARQTKLFSFKLSWQIATLQGLFVYIIAGIIAKKIFAENEKVKWC